MSKYQIPENILPGFKILADLDSEKTEKVLAVLNSFRVGDNLQKFREQLSEMEFLEDPEFLARTIISFSTLLLRESENVEMLAEDLSDAFVAREQFGKDIKESLRRKLIRIFETSDGLRETLKAYELMSENDRLYHQSRIITDIRPVFKRDIQQEAEHAVIVHRLKLEYFKNGKLRTMSMSLDLEDILDLEKQLARAKEKETRIRDNRQPYHFIELK